MTGPEAVGLWVLLFFWLPAGVAIALVTIFARGHWRGRALAVIAGFAWIYTAWVGVSLVWAIPRGLAPVETAIAGATLLPGLAVLLSWLAFRFRR